MYADDTEFTDIHMIQKVVGLFENRRMKRIVSFGLLGLEYEEDSSEEDYDWENDHHYFRGSRGLADAMSSNRIDGSLTRSSHSGRQHPMHYYTPAGDLPPVHGVKFQLKETDAERCARMFEERKKSEEKAQKKRLKKQNQKKRKQLEKEKQNAIKNEESKTDVQQSNTEERKSADEKPDEEKNASAKITTSHNETDSNEEGSSGDESDQNNSDCLSEELDMSSSFVTKAALIVKRKSEQKLKSEKEKKKPQVKQPPTVPVKNNEDPKVEKKPDLASTASSIRSVEDNIKKSTELAVLGNKLASSGAFNKAVEYFTAAIKYNPTEFKLFGNRSFCFEKMQEYEKALTDAELSLNMCPGWVKGLFRKGRALAGLKRYEDAARAFSEVLKLDSSYAEAAQELMRVQITQLMEYGFTREQSSNALIIHGTVKKALEVLSKLNLQNGALPNATPPPAQVINVRGVSPVLSAKRSPAGAAGAAPSRLPSPVNAALKKYKPLEVQNTTYVQSQHKISTDKDVRSSKENSHPSAELFPVWVGNLFYPVSESGLSKLFSKAGVVHSVKLLSFKRCAFVNFTKQEDCDEAIRRFHGFDMNGTHIAVRYPDRIPHGMGISKSAHKAHDMQNVNGREWQNKCGGSRPVTPLRPDHKDDN